jgi:hypothetical protein
MCQVCTLHCMKKVKQWGTLWFTQIMLYNVYRDTEECNCGLLSLSRNYMTDRQTSAAVVAKIILWSDTWLVSGKSFSASGSCAKLYHCTQYICRVMKWMRLCRSDHVPQTRKQELHMDLDRENSQLEDLGSDMRKVLKYILNQYL